MTKLISNSWFCFERNCNNFKLFKSAIRSAFSLFSSTEMKGGKLKAAKAKLARRKKLVEKADDKVSELEETLKATQVALEAAKGKARVAEENYEEAEFELEIIKRKTNIEEIFWRFSHMGRQILEELDNQSLVECYKVNKWWQQFIDGQKTIYIRKTLTNIGGSNVVPKKELEKESLEKLKEIAEDSECLPESEEPALNNLVNTLNYQDYGPDWKPALHPDTLYLAKLIINNTKDPETFTYSANPANPKTEYLSVLHYAALNNNLEVYKMIIHKVKNKNPSNSAGYTPLHFAARTGHFSIAELIVNNIEDLNPRNNIGRTPFDCAIAHKDIQKLIEAAMSKQIENASKRRLQ